MFTCKRRQIELTGAVEEQRRGSGEIWTRLAKTWHYLQDEHDYSLCLTYAERLFGTNKISDKVREAYDDLPIDVTDEEEMDSLPIEVDPVRPGDTTNPFLNEVMKKCGANQRQNTIDRFYDHLNVFFEKLLPQWKESGRDPDRKPEPPYKPMKHSRVDWDGVRLEKEDETLYLKTGRGQDEIVIDHWPYPKPKAAHIHQEEFTGKFYLCAQYDTDKQDLPDGLIRTRQAKGERVAAADLGEIYLASVYNGDDAIILNGGHLRELRRRQNEEKKEFQEKMDRKEKGSNRWTKLRKARSRRLGELNNKIEDLLHKMTTRLVEEVWDWGCSTLVLGDLTGIREDIDFGADMNRQLHQWAFRKFKDKLEYKANRNDLGFEVIGERDTSSICPHCGEEKTEKGGNMVVYNRSYNCRTCGQEGHRDVLGAANIRARFLHEDDEIRHGHANGPLPNPEIINYDAHMDCVASAA